MENDQRLLAQNDLALVKRSDEAQKELRGFVGHSGRFSQQERFALQIDSLAAFDYFWQSTQNAKNKLETKRQGKAGQAAANAQKFAVSAHDILQHLDPIVQVVQSLGAPYGCMAIGTISFFLAVAKNRASIENNIPETLLQIRDRIAGLNLYRHIYNDDHELDYQLQSKIIEAYNSFIYFCIAATSYYSKGSNKRWLKAVWGTSETLDDRASEVQRALVEVRYMSGELLNKNVDRIKHLNIDQAQQIEELKAQIRQLQEGRESDRLQRIQQLLGLETYSHDSEVGRFHKYQRNIDVDFDNNWPYQERMQGARLDAFRSCQNFEEWQTSKESCMLVLAGYNHESVYHARECWLSPVALDMITRMHTSNNQTKPTDPLAFYILGLVDTDPFSQIFSSIIMQLLQQKRQALQDETQYANLCTTVQKYQSERSTQQEHNYKGNALQNVALRVLNMFDPGQPVWIVIDRVDRCKSSSAFNHRKRLLKALVFLVENAKALVKVLTVVNGYDWRVEEQHDELEQSKPESVRFEVVRQEMAL